MIFWKFGNYQLTGGNISSFGWDILNIREILLLIRWLGKGNNIKMDHDEVVCGLDSSSSRQGQTASFTHTEIKFSNVIQGEKFLEDLSSFHSFASCLFH
jgi:hypothetical protein